MEKYSPVHIQRDDEYNIEAKKSLFCVCLKKKKDDEAICIRRVCVQG